MASVANVLKDIFSGMRLTQLAGPILIMLILAMMVLPLPTFLLDLFFTFNIAISIIVMLVAVNTVKPLDFSVFPNILLVTTLLRLSLNVASTRAVLLYGHNGPDAAGKVIEAFGHFLIGGNYTVGIVVFLILTVINFVVITKGAGRVAEVSARFTLDAMPGKQMAIDADLNAGLIGEDEARKRRSEVSQEADFFGSMDGASKFVRGDAVAGIIILLINLVGGLIVGVFQHNMPMMDAAKNYTLLTIGDGLVAQIPALIISIAAGMVVTRVGDEGDLGQQFFSQVFSNPKVMGITAAIMGMLGIVPGMPNLVFLLLATTFGTLAWKLAQLQEQAVQQAMTAPVAVAPAVNPEAQEASWSDVAPVDVLGLEVGYRLIPLVDKSQDGELLRRIRGIRKKFAQEIGFLPPSVHIRDNLELKPNAYRILLKGVDIGQGDSFPGMFLAINPGRVVGNIPGTPTQDPAFGLPAIWIDGHQKEQAQAYGYTVVDSSTVVATHINHQVLTHAAELLGRQETQQLIDHLAKEMPKLIEDLVPKVVPLGIIQKVLQFLLEEGIPIRDMRTIIEVLSEAAPRTQDPEILVSQVRVALGRSIIQQLYPGVQDIEVMSLDPQLERILMQAVSGNDNATLEPGLADTLVRETAAASQRQEDMGLPPVLLVPPSIRLLLARFLKRSVPSIKVLSHAEIPETKVIKVTTVIGGKKA